MDYERSRGPLTDVLVQWTFSDEPKWKSCTGYFVLFPWQLYGCRATVVKSDKTCPTLWDQKTINNKTQGLCELLLYRHFFLISAGKYPSGDKKQPQAKKYMKRDTPTWKKNSGKNKRLVWKFNFFRASFICAHELDHKNFDFILCVWWFQQPNSTQY